MIVRRYCCSVGESYSRDVSSNGVCLVKCCVGPAAARRRARLTLAANSGCAPSDVHRRTGVPLRPRRDSGVGKMCNCVRMWYTCMHMQVCECVCVCVYILERRRFVCDYVWWTLQGKHSKYLYTNKFVW